MTSIQNSIQLNRRLMIVIAILLGMIIIFLSKFYFQQNSENKALRLKIISITKNKRTPKSWSETMAKSTIATLPVLKDPVTQLPTAAPESSSQKDQPLGGLETQEIAIRLNAQMRALKNLDEDALDNNIAMAEEIISRVPDSYGAYKAKLISLLVKEGKFNSPVDESEVEDLLEHMAEFNINTDRVARREAALMANANNDIRNIENELDILAVERESIEMSIADAGEDTAKIEELNNSRDAIDQKETQLQDNILNLEQSVANNTKQFINEDIVEIPFMRMMAKNDFEGVIDNAQDFINQFPNSPNGYFYLIRALEMQGDNEQARSVIQDATIPKDVQQSLLQRLESQGTLDLKKYWQNLAF